VWHSDRCSGVTRYAVQGVNGETGLLHVECGSIDLNSKPWSL